MKMVPAEKNVKIVHDVSQSSIVPVCEQIHSVDESKKHQKVFAGDARKVWIRFYESDYDDRISEQAYQNEYGSDTDVYLAYYT